MWSVPVVEVCPWFERGSSLCGVLVSLGVRPLVYGCFDEAFGFSVGTWGVDAGSLVNDVETAAGVSEPVSVEAWTVVGQHTPYQDTEALEPGCCFGQEGGRRVGRFVRIERCVCDA